MYLVVVVVVSGGVVGEGGMQLLDGPAVLDAVTAQHHRPELAVARLALQVRLESAGHHRHETHPEH